MSRRWIVLVLLAAWLTGCPCPPAPAPMPLAPADDPDPTIETRHAALGNGFVTVDLRLRRGRTGMRPAIIASITDDAWLLDAGAVLVNYTAHWEQLRPFAKPTPPRPEGSKTYGTWLLASPVPGKVGWGWFGFIDYAAHSAIPMVLDYLATQPDVDMERIAIAGHSTYGFTALQALAEHHRFRAAAILNACGDYHAFLRDSNVALAGKDPLALDPEYETWLATREPLQRTKDLPPTPLLMINGDADVTVPWSCVVPTYDAFAKAYRRAGRAQRFRTIVLRGGTHEITPEARDALRRWWTRWLFDRRR